MALPLQKNYSPRFFILCGLSLIVIVFGAVGGWALTAPLSGAVVAPASVAVESNKKTIQHLEGGIIARIHVQEAQRVARGDVLVELQSIEAIANREILRRQLLIATASEARLIAEQRNRSVIEFPATLFREYGAESSVTMAGQKDLFADRRAVLKSETGILERRLGQIDKQAEGLEERIKSLDLQRTFMTEEIERLRRGRQLGAVALNRLAAMEREGARLRGEIGAYQSETARIGQMRAETEIEILQVKNRFRERAVSEIKEIRDEIAEIQERLSVATDVLSRTVIRSPNDGTVQNLSAHTIGGIVRPGEPLMEIVPLNDNLVINAKVRPLDIDSLSPGMTAEVRFPAFPQRQMPIILGAVEFLSPDIVTPERPEEPYYLVRVVVDQKDLPDAQRDRLSPGMPAEIVVTTVERTVVDYLIDPLSQAIRVSMREI